MNKLNNFRFRSFAGKSDFPQIAKLIQEIAIADQTQNWITTEDVEHSYAHLINSKPETDMLIAEDLQSNLVAYVRVDWEVDDEKRQVFSFPFNIHPSARSMPMYSHMLRWVETRCQKITFETRAANTSVLRAFLPDVEKDTMRKAALEGLQYKPVRFMRRMSRDLSEAIEVPPMPVGLEVRPVPESHYRTVINAVDEAFQDHWGHAPMRDEDYKAWSSSPVFKPSLWQVAWDGEQVAAGVLNRVDEEANKQFNIKRGTTDPIFTRRTWRKRGLARALLMRSLQMFKDMGMTEAILGVDTQNPSGAFVLYEKCGFKPTVESVIFEKNISSS